MFLRYNELRVFIGDPDAHGRRGLSWPSARRRATRPTRSVRGTGSGPSPRRSSRSRTSIIWGFPDKFYRKASTVAGEVTGIGASPGVVEGIARVVLREDQFDDVRAGDILVCQMTNPAWVVLFTKIVGLVTDAGGTVSHPAVLSREFGIPAVVGTSVATQQIRNGDRIRVDGTTGIVQILSTEPARPAIGIGS